MQHEVLRSDAGSMLPDLHCHGDHRHDCLPVSQPFTPCHSRLDGKGGVSLNHHMTVCMTFIKAAKGRYCLSVANIGS